MDQERNLLDELYEDDELLYWKKPWDSEMHPAEYRSALAKVGSKIGKNVYKMGGGYNGASARDVIRNDLRKNHDGKNYPFAVLEKNKSKGLLKESDIEDFVKSFEDVRAQRDYYNNKPLKTQGPGDILANGTVEQKKYLIDTGNMGPRLFGVDDWKKWYDAKMSAKEQGRKLGKLFSEQNQLEKNVYGNLSKGYGFTTEPVPEGPYKIAFGNQNHVYTKRPEDPKKYPMDKDGLIVSGHPIHLLEDGSQVIDMYTWTPKDNIGSIKNTGLLGIDGADTKHYNLGTEGAWTAYSDEHPMGKNFENNVRIGEVRPDGKNYNMELLHTQVPLGIYNNMDVIHQGRSVGTKVDVVRPKPSSPKVALENNGERGFYKIAIPERFITHIPEDNMREDWVMELGGKTTPPGFHPNKKLYGSLENFLNETSGLTKWDKLNKKDKIDLALKNAENPEIAKKFLFDEYVYRLLDNKDKKAYIKHLDEISREKNTPYDLLKTRREIQDNAINFQQGTLKGKKIF